MQVFYLLCLTLLCLGPCDGAKILGVFHPPAPSHYFLGHRLLAELANRGHEVTMISSFGLKTPMKNYRDIVLTGDDNKQREMKITVDVLKDKPLFTKILHVFEIGPALAETALNHTKVQTLLKSDEKFDLVIIESFLNEVHLGFGHHFDAPVIVLSTIGANPWVNQYTGNPAPSSYIPEMFLQYVGKMGFVERLKNVLLGNFMWAYGNTIHMNKQNEMLHKYFPMAPYIKDLYNRVAMVLLNSHVSVSSPKPHAPSMVEVGGFHIADVKELPKDLKEYLDSCTEGFILFSMGSNFKSSNLPPQLLQTLLRVFSQLPYQILWKFESPSLPSKPHNVRLEPWLPQGDVLAHPNLRLFVTHGGLLSTLEAVHHAVPVVGLPLFGDQQMNMARAEEAGIGKAVRWDTLDERSLLEAIKEVIGNPVYRENVRRKSMLMRDQPLKPIDSAMFWIEHVIRHKGADHFKTGALDLYWFQLYQLDVTLFLLVVVCLAVLIPSLVVKKLLMSKSKPKGKQEKKKKVN